MISFRLQQPRQPLLPFLFSSSSFLTLYCYVLLLWISITTTTTTAYPLIAQVPEGEEKCFKFNIPEDDDAHMVFMALPMGEDMDDIEDEIAEGHFVQELYTLTQKRTEDSMPSRLLNQAPESVKTKMDTFLQKRDDNKSNLNVIITQEGNEEYSQELQIRYFVPTVVNKVREHHKKASGGGHAEEEESETDSDEDLSGFGICFDNSNNDEDQIQVVMDIVMVSSELDEMANEPGFVKEKHLSPLEMSLDKSIHAANTVLREMKYMQEREERMRVTADSINQRVQYFSILSVVILLAVTYVQVTYLKRYFRKKKLM